jgi:hypothetical protein
MRVLRWATLALLATSYNVARAVGFLVAIPVVLGIIAAYLYWLTRSARSNAPPNQSPPDPPDNPFGEQSRAR